MFEVTEAQYAETLLAGRYTLPPGWWLDLDGDIVGPFGSREEAEAKRVAVDRARTAEGEL